ncbi:hypothetical protein T10_12989 [Trichinella papuae]|uniref:Uncharacterized protein n=1 Tax=Trichinella papuae TaxID=268474 RepID=A0A0V1MK62_9BILA|nr:hypothetical protein T10_12989 [Trichinella papuae]
MLILALKRKFISRQHIAGFIKIDGALKSMPEIFSLRPHPVDTDTVLSNSQTLVLAPRVENRSKVGKWKIIFNCFFRTSVKAEKYERNQLTKQHVQFV